MSSSCGGGGCCGATRLAGIIIGGGRSLEGEVKLNDPRFVGVLGGVTSLLRFRD